MKMTNSSSTDKDEATMAEHVADTHHNKPALGQVVTGDIVSGEVTNNDSDSGDDSEA
jgi:hypothetical protein